MTPFILLMIMGATICFLAYSIQKKYKTFAPNIEKVEGKLLGYEMEKTKNVFKKIPIVSFVTKDGDAHTQKSTDSFFSTNTKKGTAITVCYNVDNPAQIMIQGKKSGETLKVLMISAGIFFLAGLILLLDFENIIHILKK
ncbi:MAG: DUF3592 domain-containing protein [Bacteroidetes bacterium]|jgi:hypothetical protein|nr:DUF3592 domain-containing protein [Bacteroidota bacterium]